MDEMLFATEADTQDHTLWFLRPEALEWLFTLAVLGFLFAQAAGFHDPDFLQSAGERYREAVEMRVPIAAEAAGTGRVVNICAHFGGWFYSPYRTCRHVVSCWIMSVSNYDF